ncbi:unnamed protein product [Nippostrongylus brasiliensis]|uniref:HTH_Tnp_Tc3_1 domain-containing protein n=1 Tax=Nippostrongylus brasiliensis TaxID=27835 RepID=A0A0N4XV44_NIPBR|nr:unnamed protein product [Nippostrongylus brasiliensis]
MISLEDRSAVVALFIRGLSVSSIPKSLTLHQVQVHRVIKRSEETGEITNRPRGSPRRSARTPALLKVVRDKVNRNAARSIKKLAKEHNFAKGHQLTDEMKTSRLEKCRRMVALTRECTEPTGTLAKRISASSEHCKNSFSTVPDGKNVLEMGEGESAYREVCNATPVKFLFDLMQEAVLKIRLSSSLIA